MIYSNSSILAGWAIIISGLALSSVALFYYFCVPLTLRLRKIWQFRNCVGHDDPYGDKYLFVKDHGTHNPLSPYTNNKPLEIELAIGSIIPLVSFTGLVLHIRFDGPQIEKLQIKMGEGWTDRTGNRAIEFDFKQEAINRSKSLNASQIEIIFPTTGLYSLSYTIGGDDLQREITGKFYIKTEVYNLEDKRIPISGAIGISGTHTANSGL